MSYYMRGDYRTSGYYRGDPGFGSFFKRIVRKIPQTIGGLVTGGIGGAIVAATGPTRQPARRVVPTVQQAGFGMVPIAARGAVPLGKQILKGIGAIGAGVGIGELADVFMDGNGCCPSGYHPAKDGSGKCVRNRRMDVCNPRALRRSIRRLQGFEKLAARTIKSTKNVRTTRRK